MSLELVKEEVASFVRDSGNGVLLLRGRWGIGKTFFWQHMVEEAARAEKLGHDNYAYVSLFGVTDLESLKNAILVAQMKATRIVSGHGGRSFNPKEVLKNIEKLPKVQEWTGGLATSLAFTSVRKALVCFDDLERKGTGFEFQEILGLVSILKEQRDCKIAIIANDDTLDDDDRESFHRYSEKVVDINLEFVQAPGSAFDCAFDANFLYGSILREQCIKLGIVNIRILKRLHGLALRLIPLLREGEGDVVRDVLSSLVLFVWCFYDKSGSAPPFGYVKNLNVNRFVEIEHGKKDSKEKAWNRLMREYGYLYTNDLDLLLINYVERGYFDSQALSAQLGERNRDSQKEAGKQYHREAWSLYFDSLDDNEEEFVRVLVEGFRAQMAHLALGELGQTVVTLRKFDRNEEANRLIEDYVVLHRDDLAKLRSTAELVFPLGDALLVQRLEELISAVPDTRTLGDIIKRITSSSSFHPDDVTFLANAPGEDYIDFLRTERSPELRSYVKRFLEFGHNTTSEAEKKVADKAADALRKLASESRINRVRVDVLYGVSLHDDDPPKEEFPRGSSDHEEGASGEAREVPTQEAPDN